MLRGPSDIVAIAVEGLTIGDGAGIGAVHAKRVQSVLITRRALSLKTALRVAVRAPPRRGRRAASPVVARREQPLPTPSGGERASPGSARRMVVVAADLSLAALAASATGSLLLARRLRRRRRAPGCARGLMTIDSMYDLDTLRARRAEHIVTHRDLDGYFDRVWSVHPFAGIDPREHGFTAFGSPTTTPLTATHTMIEGKAGRFRRLASLPYVNFVLAQAALVLLLDRVVNDEGVAVVRGDPFYHGLLALLLSALSRCPCEIRVVGNHDAIYEVTGKLAFPRLFRWRFLERAVMRFTLSRAESVVVQSQYIREFALRHGARADRLEIAPMAIYVDPVHLAEPGDREPLDDELGLGDRPVVGFVGRLDAVKHPDDVIVSLAKARAQDARLAAVIVGDGGMRDELRALCGELGVERDVVFAGERDQHWIARLLPRCAVIAAPLAGLALVEAALSGTPIVAYDVERHPEFIGTEREGILVPYRDTDAMAAAIRALVDDPGRASRLAAAARARALEIMEPGRLLAHERALADRLLARAPAPAS